MRRPHRRRFLHLAAGAVVLSAGARRARAQAYPTRPITLVVPFAAGGSFDVIARVITPRLSEILGQQVIVENVGAAAGASLEHTHSQLIVTPIVPVSVWEEMSGSLDFFNYRGRCIYCDMAHQDLSTGARLVTETELFVVLCPYAARFPFETWILPKRHEAHFEESDARTLANLAWVLR